MTDEPDVELTAWLARARAGLTPTEADAARVRAAVGVALGAASGGTTSGRATHAGAAVPRAPWRSLGRLGVVTAVAAAAGTAGYALGYRAGVDEQRRVRLSEPTAVIRLPAEAAGDAASTASAPAASRAPELPLEPRRSGHAARAAAPGSAPTTSASAAPSAAPMPSGESSLELEARLLGRVERSLRDSNPRLALGLLGELDREVPGGQLAEEREAARVMAHCALGTPHAAKLASDFAAHHANSAYGARIADACAGAEHGDAGE